MDAIRTLHKLFGSASAGGHVELRQIPEVTYSRFIASVGPVMDEVLEKQSTLTNINQYFGTMVRDSQGRIRGGTSVWLDVDGELRSPSDFPSVGLVLKSGRGTHVYWFLDGEYPAGEVMRQVRLACFAYGGDPQVAEPHRMMRVPGSTNIKYTDDNICTVLLETETRLHPNQLDEILVAVVIASIWEEGSRHEVALALGGLLTYAGWDQERASNVIDTVCELTGDTEKLDRITAVRESFNRHAAGTRMSVEAIKDRLKDRFDTFVELMGAMRRDGDLLLNGEVVGHITNVERDIVRAFRASSTWAAADGALVRWTKTHWAMTPRESLVSDVFQFIEKLMVFDAGIERDMVPTARLARSCASIVEGQLYDHPLPMPEAWAFPVANGILDLRDCSLHEPDPSFRNRWTSPVEYQPDAECPDWTKFLTDSGEVQCTFLQEYVGYCLEHGNPWQRMVWIYGPSGTGKSTLVNTVGALFGEASVAIRPEQLDDYGIASLAHARVAVCTELTDRVLKTANLKSIVSGDAMRARFPYGRPFSVRFTGKILWSSNSLPPVDQFEGMARRVIVVPFTTKPDKTDVTLGERLANQLPGILNWALEGYRRVTEYTSSSSWPLPKLVLDTSSEYHQEADVFRQFVEEELILDGEDVPEDERGIMPARALYRRYVNWAESFGRYVVPMGPVWRREMKRFGLVPDPVPRLVDGVKGRVWIGGQLAPTTFGDGSY